MDETITTTWMTPNQLVHSFNNGRFIIFNPNAITLRPARLAQHFARAAL